MFYIFILLILSTTTCSFQESIFSLAPDSEVIDDYILCRNCGSDISSSHYVVPVKSPASRHAFNDTLFNKEVLVQVLSNNIFFDFPVITTTHSNCVATGEWEEYDSWFPGYRWKLCVCPDCGTYVGWLFEPLNSVPAKPFFGLILYTLIGESCK